MLQNGILFLEIYCWFGKQTKYLSFYSNKILEKMIGYIIKYIG